MVIDPWSADCVSWNLRGYQKQREPGTPNPSSRAKRRRRRESFRAYGTTSVNVYAGRLPYDCPTEGYANAFRALKVLPLHDDDFSSLVTTHAHRTVD